MDTTTVLSHKDVVTQMLKGLSQGVASSLVPVRKSSESLALKLMLYRNAIAPSFVPWMAQVWNQCSGQARKKLGEKLECEVREDHPEMLRRFVRQMPEQHRVMETTATCLMQYINPLAHKLDQLVDSTLDGLLVMAGLETASLIFIPWMRGAGLQLGFTDFEYVDNHGSADIEYAMQLADAVEEAAQLYHLTPEQLEQVKHPLLAVKDLLCAIFNLE